MSKLQPRLVLNKSKLQGLTINETCQIVSVTIYMQSIYFGAKLQAAALKNDCVMTIFNVGRYTLKLW